VGANLRILFGRLLPIDAVRSGPCGDPGFVHVVDERNIAFPNSDVQSMIPLDPSTRPERFSLPA
jgi:hypothetical protein